MRQCMYVKSTTKLIPLDGNGSPSFLTKNVESELHTILPSQLKQRIGKFVARAEEWQERDLE